MQNLAQTLSVLKANVENISVKFSCETKRQMALVNVSGQGANELRGRHPARIEDKKVYRIKPWMMSFAPRSNTIQGSAKAKSSSFFFPSIGYSNVSYKEGGFENSFSNAFVALRYREIISSPQWHFDAEVKFGALSLSNDYLDSTAQVLDVDFTIGARIQNF